MYNNAHRFQLVPDNGYGYINNYMQQQHHDIFIQNFGRKEYRMEESDVMYYDGYRPLHGQVETLNIQDRMLHDKVFYSIQNENANKHPTMVPNGMYFPHLEHTNCSHVVVPSMIVEGNYERPTEQQKLPAQTSMDYGYSSHCSLEETQHGLYDYLENMTATSSIDDEVFHLEMSDEKLKGKRQAQLKQELKHKRLEDKNVRRSYMKSKSTNNCVPDLLVQNITKNTSNQHQAHIVPKTPQHCDHLNEMFDFRECCYMSPNRRMIKRIEEQKHELCSESNEAPVIKTKGLSEHDWKASIEDESDELGFGIVPYIPCLSPPIDSALFYDNYYEEHQQDYNQNYNTNDAAIKGIEIVADVPNTDNQVSKYNYNPEDSSEYAIDVYLWKRSIESSFQPKDILKLQNEVTAEMRHTLLNWLVSVNRQFQFTLETWCLAVNIMDRFLSMQPLNKDCLQLVGLTAFFIAAKQEEVEPPEISELVSLCARSYEHKQFQWMEIIILTHLNFRLVAPTLNFFVFHLIEIEMGFKTENCTKDTENLNVETKRIWPMELTRKLIEKVLCEERLARISYSMVAHAIFEFLTKHFILNCYDEIDACANDEMFVDSTFKMLYVDILDQYEDDDL